MDEPENMDASRMMFDWGDQGMGPGFTQEQVDGEFSAWIKTTLKPSLPEPVVEIFFYFSQCL